MPKNHHLEKQNMCQRAFRLYHLKNTVGYGLLTLLLLFVTSCGKPKENKQINLETNQSKTEYLPTFLIYGERAPSGYLEEQDSVTTKEFGFKIKRVADCEVSEELMDSVRIINMENNDLMNAKYGRDWKRNFEEQTHLKMAIPEI